MTPNTSIELIDKICCDFEDSWRFENTLDDLRRYLAEHLPEHACSYPILLAEIAQIDIERRWRYLAQNANRLAASDLNSWLAKNLHVPTARDYLAWLTSPPSDIDAVRRKIADSELKARCKFGDAPSPAKFGFPRELWEAYQKYMPKATIFRDHERPIESIIVSPVTIGRQSLGEPDPFTVHHEDSLAKLICCPIENMTISRQQVRLEILIGKWVEIGNPSRNRDFAVIGEAAVRPGGSTLVSMPCTIDLGDIRMRIRRSSLAAS